jgi:hypothetical protein
MVQNASTWRNQPRPSFAKLHNWREPPGTRGQSEDASAVLAYPNNVVEQDHRRVKTRVQPMLGGIEFAQKIKKQQYDLRHLSGSQASPAEMWQRAMAA